MGKELPPFEFSVERIQDCGFSFEESILPAPDKMQIGYAMTFLFDIDQSWIQYLLRADFRDNETGITFITGTVLTRFHVNALKSFVDETDKVVFPGGTLETLFGIAFSHLRAMMAKNVAGSRFSNIYVPVIDPKIVFNDLLQFNIEKMKKAINKGDLELVKKIDPEKLPDLEPTKTSAKKTSKKVSK